MNLKMKTSTLTAVLAGILLTSSAAFAANCDASRTAALATQITDAKDRQAAREEYVARMTKELDEIKAEGRAMFGGKLPTLAEADALASKASVELKAMTPEVDTPATRKRAARIAELTKQLRTSQVASSAEFDRVQAAGPQAVAAYERTQRAKSESANKELRTLFDAQEKDVLAAVKDKGAFHAKQAELRKYIRFTEIDDRGALLVSARTAAESYRRQVRDLSEEAAVTKASCTK
jgi:uncharacterized membrane protein